MPSVLVLQSQSIIKGTRIKQCFATDDLLVFNGLEIHAVLLLPPQRLPVPRARGSELYHTSYNQRDAAPAAQALPSISSQFSQSHRPSMKHGKRNAISCCVESRKVAVLGGWWPPAGACWGSGPIAHKCRIIVCLTETRCQVSMVVVQWHPQHKAA